MPALLQRAFCEWLGTAFLLAAVVGSGIMAQKLAGDAALALLCNTLPTGAILTVLILVFGPLSGAHFNRLLPLPCATSSRGRPR
jgi:glycerol uptake facilitator-like aquaporin